MIFKSMSDASDSIANGTATVARINGNDFLHCTFKDKSPYKSDTTFEVGNQISLSQAVATAAGCNSVSILEGTYNFYQNQDSVSVDLPAVIK